MSIDFKHNQSAHCESGVVANLLNHAGVAISEPMTFGIGGGLFFGYFPFIRINKLPLVTYRVAAGKIIKRVGLIPGFEFVEKKFREQEAARDELNRLLDEGIPVGLQVGVFWLPFFPRALRFHFNAHNLVVYGRQGGDYLISDPVFPAPVRCEGSALARARFSSGALAPKGKLYYLRKTPDASEIDWQELVVSGICEVAKMMIPKPFPLIGVKGIRFIGNRMVSWPGRFGEEKAILHLGHVVRMQEEIGTGGGGFRFMYGAFLQESSKLFEDDFLHNCGDKVIAAGDKWRDFGSMAVRICKKREKSGDSYSALRDILYGCAEMEEEVFQELFSWAKEMKKNG